MNDTNKVVLQSSFQGPIIYLVCMDDIPCILKFSNVSMQADDANIIFPSTLYS